MNQQAPTLRTAPITLDGKPLSFADMVRIGSRRVPLAADEGALRRVAEARKVVEQTIANHQPVYGSTPGVGAMKDVEWTDDPLDAFTKIGRAAGRGRVWRYG